jgi:hypothetical protein
MWSALAAVALAWSVSDAALPLESRALNGPPFVIADTPFVNFDIYDVRDQSRAPELPVSEETPRTIFRIKKHLGIGGGYDQKVVHGSIGLYITVAEMGRWNLGMTSPGIGLSRYPMKDRYRGSYAKTEMTLLISLASVHYRGGYIQSLRKNWYLNFEQVFDSRSNMGGSQVGISFATP